MQFPHKIAGEHCKRNIVGNEWRRNRLSEKFTGARFELRRRCWRRRLNIVASSVQQQSCGYYENSSTPWSRCECPHHIEIDSVEFGRDMVEQRIRGADVNALSQGSQTPSHIAATISNCRQTAMTLLMDSNISAAALNNSNEMAADIARHTGLTFPVFKIYTIQHFICVRLLFTHHMIRSSTFIEKYSQYYQ